MKIDYGAIDLSNFNIIDGEFCGLPAFLVNPNHIGTKWTKETLIFRSSIWDKKNGELLSAGFPKFYNYGEKPDLYPSPENFKDKVIFEKKDGSCAICDYVNNQISIRTRGTLSYKTQKNFSDFEELLKFTNFVDYLKKNPQFSYIFELETPNNVIVLNCTEIKFTLLDIINKQTYKTIGYDKLKECANLFGIPLPQEYSFNSLAEIVNSVKLWKGKEGVVVWYNNYENRVKIKGDWYLNCHRIKSNLNNIENIIDLFFELGCPHYSEFYKKVEETFDYEIAQQLVRYMSRVCDSYKQVLDIVAGMNDFINNHKLLARKDFAQKTIQSYGETNRASFVFTLLDKKQLDKEQLKKLLWQCIKS